MSVDVDSSGVAVMGLVPGRYLVTAGAEGYQSESNLVDVVGGDVLLQFELTPSPPQPDGPFQRGDTLPRAIVSGRVLSLAGDPVADAIVELWREEYSVSAVTTIDGSFRVAVPVLSPRTVAIKVRPLGFPKNSTPEVTNVPDYVQPSFSVAVSPNRKTSDVEIRVPVHPEFKITATINDGTGHLSPGTKVTASGAESTAVFLVRPDGTAISAPLPTGTYNIEASVKGPTGRLVARTVVEIQDQPPPHILLDLLPEALPRARASGRVEFDGLPRPLQGPDPLRVLSHRSRGAYTDTDPNGLVEADGSFVLDGLLGDHCFQLTGIPFGWRLASVMQAERDITTVPYPFEPGEQLSDIVLRVVRRSSVPQLGELRRACPLE
jgi:hypothetical protein